MNEEKKKQIIEFLSNRRRGSTISEISKELGVSRVTASKYLNILVAEEEVDQREVGRAKLHYLDREVEPEKGAES